MNFPIPDVALPWIQTVRDVYGQLYDHWPTWADKGSITVILLACTSGTLQFIQALGGERRVI
jgi:hypothetical protein